MTAVPEWPAGTVAVLVTAEVHAIPVSTAVRVGERAVALALGARRGSLARLRGDPRCALVVVCAQDVACTLYGTAAVTGEVAGVVAVLCAGVAVLLASATRFGDEGSHAMRWLARLATVGYAVPGPVVAIGVLGMLAAADTVLDALGSGLGGVLVTGTVAGLVYAYAVRFLALGYNSVDASLEKVSPSLTAAALTLGARPRGVVRRVHLPLVRSGVGVALVLVAVDALKELPIVLLLRPFGFETLAIWVYQLASESRWEPAGLPALTIVAVAVVPVVLLFRRTLQLPSGSGLR